MTTTKHDFRKVNRLKRLNMLLQILLAVSLLGAVNYLGSSYYQRTDLTENRKHSLNPETQAYLRTVSQPINIYVVLPKIESDEYTMRMLRDLERLLGNMEHYLQRIGNPNLNVEFVDVYRERNRAAEILGRYGITSQSSIVVASGDRMKQISINSLYVMSDNKIRAFRGETEFLSAILNLSQAEEKTIYFMAGQGEHDLDSVDPVDGLSSLRSFLRERGFSLATIELTEFSRIPEDAAAVVIVSPKIRYREREVSLLRDYLTKRNGSLLVLADPGGPTGLESLALEWGIAIDDRTVVDVGSDYQSATGDLVIRNSNEHPITNFIRNLDVTVLMGLPRPILESRDTAIDPSTLEIVSLLQSSSQSWAESDLRPGTTVTFNPDEDLAGPVSIAVASQRKSDSGLDLSLAATQGGRIAVLGDADFVTNARLNAFGNRLLFLSALNWCLDAGQEFIVPPKEVQSYLIVISQNELRNLLLQLMALPTLLMLIGIGVAFIRR